MADYPRTLPEFRERFATEADCLDYLVALRWRRGFRCPSCGHSTARRTPRALYECLNCRRQTSPTAGTIFHDSRKPLRLWFEAMWHVTSQKYGANALGLQRILGLGSYHTAWEWLHRLRRAMVNPGRDQLAGVVEVDETMIGGVRAGKRGRGAAGKTLVVIAVEDTGVDHPSGRGIGRIRLEQLPDASAVSLSGFVSRHIRPGSTVRTDGWSGYNDLECNGYEHQVGASLDTEISHRVVALLKRWLLGTYQGAVSCHQLPYYLDEFTFRFNRRKSASRGLLFYRLLQQAVLTPPVSIAQLRADAAAGHAINNGGPQ